MVFLGLTDLDFPGEVHIVTTYCSVCGYPPSEYLGVAVLYVCVWVNAFISVPGSLVLLLTLSYFQS